MYLEKRSYVQQWEHIKPEKQFRVTVTQGGQPYDEIRPERVSYVIEQVAYWRKANAIHRWFVSNVQNGEDDCGQYYVSAAQLGALLKAAEEAVLVLDRGDDVSALLPTRSGFFFGSIDYDESYRDDLIETIGMLSALLGEPNADQADYYYRASW